MSHFKDTPTDKHTDHINLPPLSVWVQLYDLIKDLGRKTVLGQHLKFIDTEKTKKIEVSVLPLSI